MSPPLSALEPKSGVPVVCLAAKPAPIYRPRQPRQTPLYKTIERYLPEFERTYDRRYAKQYGPWRPIIGEVARRFLRCGDLHFGFARVRCPDCRHEMFVAFSCQQRCLCPSCDQKRTLLTAETIAQTICVPVRIGNLSSRSPSGSEFSVATTATCWANWPVPLGGRLSRSIGKCSYAATSSRA